MTGEAMPVYLRSVHNFRDIGGVTTVDGKHIKEKMLFRSASPDNITGRDIRKMHELNIKTIVDLRAPDETGRKNKKFEGIQTVSLPLDFERTTRERLIPLIKQKNAYNLINDLIGSLYLEILDGSVSVFRDIVDLLLEPSRCPMLIHCHAGKDRTGIISALIQMALGADKQSIIEGYMASNEALLPSYKRRLIISKILYLGFLPANNILYAITVRSNNIESVIERVITFYGGIEGYLKSSGPGMSDFKELRERFVI
jgi:protein-tyrosine phosphatase